MEALKTNPQTEHELGDESFMSAAELGAYTAKLKAAKALQTEDRAEEARAELIKTLSETIEVTPKKVHEIMTSLLYKLRIAAEQGKNELLVMRFPNVMCSDGGRAINNFESGWPETLTGRPRQAFEFWRDRLQPAGYGLKAVIVNFPDGMPGDVGFLLTWETRSA
ncbi:hypothetical protein [Methylorubrum extorquens]|uniref:Histidine kinase n=1 Tax=Methylorubrum extorquens TaxID=408 RepID=A0AAX3WKV4_METEX|nr:MULTISPECIES: hypothetical protein [Methylobacteriaceae]KQQ21263.1 hypothetical protein ASF56_19180 [Methylobacterium sp. Leaf122]WHQ70160.1 hypothetical protein KEC54_00265 [Methylorubrum extorquens]WHQ71215.1 hypothetical protein KEC54_06485 [Methylorubrum extorquens]